MPRFAAIAVLMATAGLASAQPQPGGAQRPGFSPYLNLARGGTNPGINYLGVVRPQIQQQQMFGQLQQQLRQTNQNLQDVGNSVYGTDPNAALSGHASVFNNTGRYFNSNPAFGGAMGGGGSGRISGGISSRLPQPTALPTAGASRSSRGGGMGARR